MTPALPLSVTMRLRTSKAVTGPFLARLRTTMEMSLCLEVIAGLINVSHETLTDSPPPLSPSAHGWPTARTQAADQGHGLNPLLVKCHGLVWVLFR